MLIIFGCTKDRQRRKQVLFIMLVGFTGLLWNLRLLGVLVSIRCRNVTWVGDLFPSMLFPVY